MKPKIIVCLLLLIAAATGVSYAAAPVDNGRIEALEKKVQALEAKLGNIEKLTMEFADEIALVNMKVTTIEEQLKKKA